MRLCFLGRLLVVSGKIVNRVIYVVNSGFSLVDYVLCGFLRLGDALFSAVAEPGFIRGDGLDLTKKTCSKDAKQT